MFMFMHMSLAFKSGEYLFPSKTAHVTRRTLHLANSDQTGIKPDTLKASRRASDAPPQLALPAALRPALEAELARLGRCGGWRAALLWRRRRRLKLVRLRSFWPHFSAELLGELLQMDEGRAHVAAALTLDLLELRWRVCKALCVQCRLPSSRVQFSAL